MVAAMGGELASPAVVVPTAAQLLPFLRLRETGGARLRMHASRRRKCVEEAMGYSWIRSHLLVQSFRIDPAAPIGCFGSDRHDKCAKQFRTLRDKKWFQTSIILVIFLAGILVGIQTYDIQDDSVVTITECVAVCCPRGWIVPATVT